MSDQVDFFRDPDDLVEVLQAYGVLKDSIVDRARVQEFIKTLPKEDVAAAFIRHATGFSRMVQDIDSFCLSVGVAVNGRIQIKDKDLCLQFDGLSSGWVFDGPSDWESAEERALALAEELRYLTEAFDPGRATFSQDVLTSFGASLRGTIYADVGLSGASTEETIVQKEDLLELENMIEEVESLLGKLRNVELAPAVASALDGAALNLNATHQVLSRYDQDSGRSPTQAMLILHNLLTMLLMQVTALVEEVNLGRRVHRERSDFLRTEFWKHRWRLYEIWLLVRVLTALRNAGGHLTLNGVKDGVWSLQYGRAVAPVATCLVGESPLRIYYQFHVQAHGGADMPDIVVVGAQPLIVLDPKHGLSYRRAEVQRVLMRYSASFAAKLTAIVNFYPIPSYPFETTLHSNKRWLLASGIIPGSIGAQRLELLVRDAVLAAGYVSQGTRGMILSTKPIVSTQAFLVYYASWEIEVDELAGFWSARAGRGAERLSNFDTIIGGSDQAGYISVKISASRSGDLWLLTVAHQISKKTTNWRLTEKRPPEKEISKACGGQEELQPDGEISPSGRYRIENGPKSRRNGVRLLNVVDNSKKTSLPLIRFQGRCATDFIWSPDESSFAFLAHQTNEKRLLTARLGDRFACPASLPGQRPTAYAWMTPALLRSVIASHRACQSFIIQRQASESCGPGERSFYHPPSRQEHKPVLGFVVFYNFQLDSLLRRGFSRFATGVALTEKGQLDFLLSHFLNRLR
jgi:hypothetical protein